MPIDHHFIAPQHRVATMELIGCTIPHRVYLGIEMNGCCIKMSQRRWRFEEHTAVGVHRLRHLILYLKWFGREDAVVGFFPLLFLLLFLLPFLYLLLLGLQSLFIRCLGYQFNGIYLSNQLAQGIRHQILHRQFQRVLIDQHRVAQPVSQGVLFRSCF